MLELGLGLGKVRLGQAKVRVLWQQLRVTVRVILSRAVAPSPG